MASLRDSFVSAAVYNELPPIHRVSKAPTEDADNLQILRNLLSKYNTPSCVSIRLIHKHFDAEDGEVMVFKTVDLPEGPVQLMRPVSAGHAEDLKPLHYFVDGNDVLQAYEYTADKMDVPDLSMCDAFFAAFCRIVVDRGLQRKFGIKIMDNIEAKSYHWTEYELPRQRSTILIPQDMPKLPDDPARYSVMTEWAGAANPDYQSECDHSITVCSHCTHQACFHYQGGPLGPQPIDSGLYIAGQMVEIGNPVHSLVTRALEVW